MQKSYESLKDNDIEVILLAYLLKHPELLDTHFEQISNNLFANPENLKIFKVLGDFHQSQKNISIDTIKKLYTRYSIPNFKRSISSNRSDSFFKRNLS